MINFVSAAKSLISSESSTPAKLIALFCSEIVVPATNLTMISRGTYSPSEIGSIASWLATGDGVMSCDVSTEDSADAAGASCKTGESVAATSGSPKPLGDDVSSAFAEILGSGACVSLLDLAGAGTKRVTIKPNALEIDSTFRVWRGKVIAMNECRLYRCRNATSLATL